ncbi:MAG: hypothetical protein EXR74_06820 [Bdellovibrionales bacterium]|nr:hypothetical protein [Bdellovibrionales bacterium]
MGNHWIVLINKSPRGPLTFEEVSILLKDNVIKRTDLALQISLENKETKSDWKFLWQYSEFDLRAKNDSAESSAENKTLKNNRRTPLNENKIKTEISAVLPDEIAMINPEDLVISNQRNRIRQGSSPLILDDEGIREDIQSPPKGEGSRWRYLGLGSFMLLAVFYWKGSGYREPIEVETSSLPERSISKDSTVITAQINPAIGKASSLSLTDSTFKAQPPALSQVKPPGRNEISLEDYQKLKEERAGKERLEEEDQRRENEEAAMLAQEEQEQEQDQEAMVGNSEREDTEEVTELPLMKSKTKKFSKRRKNQKRKLAEKSEEGSDRERSTDSLEKENDSKYNNEERNEP